MNQLKIFKLNDGENWWIAAYSKADALEIGKTMDIGVDDDFENVDVCEEPHEKVLIINLDYSGDDPYVCIGRDERLPSEPYREDDGDLWKVSATIEKWAECSNHGDCIASSVW